MTQGRDAVRPVLHTADFVCKRCGFSGEIEILGKRGFQYEDPSDYEEVDDEDEEDEDGEPAQAEPDDEDDDDPDPDDKEWREAPLPLDTYKQEALAVLRQVPCPKCGARDEESMREHRNRTFAALGVTNVMGVALSGLFWWVEMPREAIGILGVAGAADVVQTIAYFVGLRNAADRAQFPAITRPLAAQAEEEAKAEKKARRRARDEAAARNEEREEDEDGDADE